MAQFDVHALRDGRLVVNAQSDLIATPGSLFVIPLIPPDQDARATERLNPSIDVDGTLLVLATQLAAGVPTAELGPTLVSLYDHDLEIKSALDMLISGY